MRKPIFSILYANCLAKLQIRPFTGYQCFLKYSVLGLGGPVVKDLPANAGDVGSIPGVGRSHMLWDS